MKKFVIGFAVLTLFLASCQKQEFDSPGNIPGMGNTPGNLEVKAPFNLPSGISIVGEISGIDNSGAKSGDSKSASDVKSFDPSCYGSGGKMIKLTLTLLNSGSTSKTVFFPKGLLWKCNVEGYQHAILLQTTWCTIKANSKRTIIMDLYCINYGLAPSDQISTFQILGVTGSKVIGNLLNLIGWRKINFEMIYGTSGTGKGIASEPTYDEITDRLQNVVWGLTNFGKDVSSEDKSFIESIPELAPTEIPVVDAQGNFPEYFEDFVITGI